MLVRPCRVHEPAVIGYIYKYTGTPVKKLPYETSEYALKAYPGGNINVSGLEHYRFVSPFEVSKVINYISKKRYKFPEREIFAKRQYMDLPVRSDQFPVRSDNVGTIIVVPAFFLNSPDKFPAGGFIGEFVDLRVYLKVRINRFRRYYKYSWCCCANLAYGVLWLG